MLAFTSATRLFALTWRNAGHDLPVEAWWGREALSDGFEFTVDILAPDAFIPLKHLLGQCVTFHATLSGGERSARSALVRRAAKHGTDGGFARYRLTLVPWTWLLTRGRHNRVFQEKSVVEILDQVFARYAEHAAWHWHDDVARHLEGTRPRSYCVQYRESDYAFASRLLAEEGLGWCIEEAPDAPCGHRMRIFADSAAFPDDPSAAHRLGGPGLRFHRADSQEEQDSIVAFGQHLRIAPTRVSGIAYDYRVRTSAAASVPSLRPLGQVAIEHYADAGPYAFAGHAEADRVQRLRMEALESHAERHLGRSTVRSLRPGSAFDLIGAPTSSEVPVEPPRFAVTEVLHVGINNLPREAIERIAARLAKGDETPSPADTTDTGDAIAPGSAPARPHAEALALAAQRGYANSFNAIPARTPWRPILTDTTGAQLNPRPTAPGPMSAIVVGPQGETAPSGANELWCDALGRIKVRFHWQHADTPDDTGTCWLRVASRQAGARMGWQWLPRIGQEVLVDFLGGDIDRPVVLGALYNGRGEGGLPPTPGGADGPAQDTTVFDAATDHRPAGQGNLSGGNSPAWHGGAAASHRHADALSGLRSKEFGGHGYNQLVFDDSDAQSRIQLKSTQHASELNLGHLIHQADNYRGSFRGTGAELRTDAWGALRAGRGIVLSTWPAQGEAQPAGDLAPGVALLRQATQLASTLSRAATTHQTVALASVIGTTAANASHVDPARAPLAALEQLARHVVSAQSPDARTNAVDSGTASTLPHLGAPALVSAARAGLGFVAGGHLQATAGETLTLMSGDRSNLAIAGRSRLHTGQAIGLVAGALEPGPDGHGLRLIAARGDIEMQAQSDEQKFLAKQDLKLVSAAANIDFAAAKKIVLSVEGGASITIDGGITVACPGTITVHAAKKSFAGPASLNYGLPRFPHNPFELARPRFNFRLTDVPGPDGAPLGNTPWRIVEAPDSVQAFASRTNLLTGRSGNDGRISLSPDEERLLGTAHAQSPGMLWVVFEGQAKRLEVTRERPDWTERQKLDHALDAMGYADSYGMAGDGSIDPFRAPLARRELRLNAANAIFERFKKGHP